jgi:hypothetical protein
MSTRTLTVGVALGALLAGAVATTAQDRPVKDCPKAAARGMTAQAGGTTAKASPAPTGFWGIFLQGGGGRNPVGSPGMYTGVDTGVTRGPALGAGTGTTGTYGAGTESNSIVSNPFAGSDSGSASASSAQTAKADDPC